MMLQANTNASGCDDNAGGSLCASLLITNNTSSTNRYRKLWQRGNICVGLLITLNKRSSSSPSPTTAAEQLRRTISSGSRSEIAIDMNDREEEKKEAEEQRRTISSGSRSEIAIDMNDREEEKKEAEEQRRTISSGSRSEISIDINDGEKKKKEAEEQRRNAVNRFVKDKDLKSLRDFGGAEQVAALFNSNLDTGLCVGAAAADPEAWNTTTSKPVHSLMLHKFKKACNSYTIFLLLISAALNFGTEILMEGTKYGWHDGVTILTTMFLLVTVPPVAEFLKAKMLQKEMQRKEKKVTVIRSGEPQIVGVSTILLGDIVDLKEGDRVPADGLFVGSGMDTGTGGLVSDEVLASKIDSDHNPFLLSGFKVLQGNGRMIVTSVNTNTVIGKVMSMVNDDNDPNNGTLLQTRIERPINYADKIALCISILITLVLLIRFLRRNHVEHNFVLPELKGNFPVEKLMKMFDKILLKPRGLVCVLTTTLTAVVLGFQHGLSLALTISLSYWNQKVASSNHANPQTLSACGTFGFITTICIDVSGGLMFNQIEVEKFLVGEKEIDSGEESNISPVVLEALQQGIGMYNLVPDYLRSPMDRLLYSWAQSKWGVAVESREESFGCAASSSSFGDKYSQLCDVELATVAMESREMELSKGSFGCASSSSSFGGNCGQFCEVELAAVVMESGKDSSGYVGSSSSFGDKCSQLCEVQLAEVAMESNEIEFKKESSGCASSGYGVDKCGPLYEVELAAMAMESMKMRFNEKGRGVLMRKNGDDEKIMHLHWRGSAHTILRMCSHYYDYQGTIHVLEYNQRCKFEKLIKDMVDCGLHPIAFAYKPTDVEEIGEDGLILLAQVSVKFREETKLVMDSFREAGVNIKLMMGDELSNAHETVAFGRSLPEDKLLLIQYLKQQGHVVAFYGGLTTGDTPALKEADVGIAEETQSTEMARESSNIIFTSSHGGLSSLTMLLKHSRCVYHNIQKFIELQLTAWFSGILITAISTMSLGESPITSIQLIWANLIVCMLGGMMMAMEPPSQGLMALQPQPTRTKSIMTKVMWRNFAVQVVFQVSILLIFQFEGQVVRSLNQNVIKTMIFNTFILCQVFNVFNAMELEKKEIFMVVIQSYYFLASVGVVLAVQVLLVQLATILTNYARLSWLQWAFCFFFSAFSWGFDLALKFICVFLNKSSIWLVSSRIMFSATTPSPCLPYMGFMFSMFLFFSFSYYFKPDIAWTMR